MALFDLFSKRQKRFRGDVPDVYVYDDVPRSLRVQLVQILQDGIGPDRQHCVIPLHLYSSIHKTLCREYGVFSLAKDRRSSDCEAVANYLLQTDEVEHIIDIVELGLRAVDTVIRERSWQLIHCSASPDETIAEANSRFKPALKLLADPKFNGANDEFLKAHEHYRHGRHKECLAECLKAFESTMKTICDLKGWPYQPRDTAKALIDTCIANGLFPAFMQSHVGNLRTILESGVPTVRNKLGGHGQGATVTTVSESIARFALHSTAANILLFVESV
jgi:hypothetical protein